MTFIRHFKNERVSDLEQERETAERETHTKREAGERDTESDREKQRQIKKGSQYKRNLTFF